MVNSALSGSCGHSSALGENGEALVTNLGEAAGDGDALRTCALAAIDRDLAVPQGRHIGRVADHDAGLTLGTWDVHHVDVVGHDQPVGRDELKMQAGHYCLLSIA